MSENALAIEKSLTFVRDDETEHGLNLFHLVPKPEFGRQGEPVQQEISAVNLAGPDHSLSWRTCDPVPT